MAADLWEQLADTPVPPAPAAPVFDRGVTERINSRLLWLHLIEFVVRTIPFAIWHLACGVVGFFVLTATGKYPKDLRPRTDGENRP